MEKAIDTRTKLLTKNPFSLMLELSIPAILGMVVVGLYNMMDSIFIGQMVGAAQMGAVSVSYPFTLINAGSAAMLGVGSASVLSRAIGKKDEGTIKKIMGNLVAMVILLSVIYTIIGMVFTRQLLSLAGASDNILNYAEKYLRIVFAGSLFVNFFQSANMVIRGEGQLKKAMSIIASGAILNIILDPIFITILKPYGMGIEAAAFATILSQFVQAVITLWYFRKKSPNVKIGRIRIDGELLPQVLSVGVSALLMQILTLVQQTVIYRVAANYGGETSQILLGAALRFWNFSFVPLWGISQGFQPAAGTNYGAKDYDRVKTLTKVFVIAATVLSLIFYIPAELFPAKVLSMFITTPGVAASGATNFRIMFSTYLEVGIESFSALVSDMLVATGVNEVLCSLIVDGIIAGVGGILTFLPNIFILFLALAFLEDSGYMARVAYVMEGIMSKLGLSGRAFIPMILGFGCTVPAIMASRTLENKHDRFKVMLITPFMSCSARLPIYILFAEMFFKERAMIVAYSMYLIGLVVAILVAAVIHLIDKRKSENYLLIELPEYKIPSSRTVAIYVWEKVKDYLTKAGTTIFVASIAMWILLNFGPHGYTTEMVDSFGAVLGHWLVPFFEPIGLGYWQIAVALIAGISAKEVVVSSCAVLFGIPNITSEAGMNTLVGILGTAGFGQLNAFCLMIFCLLYIPCAAAMATIKREARSWKWMCFSAVFQLAVAWGMTFIIYHIGRIV